MTPKEKAEELISTFRPYVGSTFRGTYDEDIERINVKYCAIACMNEIISSMGKYPDDEMHIDELCGNVEYWQQVKKELVTI